VIDQARRWTPGASLATVFGRMWSWRSLDRTDRWSRVGRAGLAHRETYGSGRIDPSPIRMVSVPAPTCAGQTTTLYASCLPDQLVGDEHHQRVEDPVDYCSRVIESDPYDDSGLTFATGLKALLRQDPDVILVRLDRDADTARDPVQSAFTWHLVLIVVCTQRAVSGRHRFLGMGIDAFFDRSSLLA